MLNFERRVEHFNPFQIVSNINITRIHLEAANRETSPALIANHDLRGVYSIAQVTYPERELQRLAPIERYEELSQPVTLESMCWDDSVEVFA